MIHSWRFFALRALDDAIAHAQQGGVAVHDTGVAFRQFKRTAHLFAANDTTLARVAWSLGIASKWLQRDGTPRAHFDLFGKPLARALALCENRDDVQRWITETR